MKNYLKQNLEELSIDDYDVIIASLIFAYEEMSDSLDIEEWYFNELLDKLKRNHDKLGYK